MLRSEACNILKSNLKEYQASSSSNVWDEPTTTASISDTSNSNTKRLRYKSSLYYYKRLNCKDFITGDLVNIDSAEEADKQDKGENKFSLSSIIPANFEMPFISSENKHKDNAVNDGHNSDSSPTSKKSEISNEHKLKNCIQWRQKYTESDSSSSNKPNLKSSHTDTDTTADSSTTTDTGVGTSVENREEIPSLIPLSRVIPINKSYQDINIKFISLDPQVRDSSINRQLAQNMPPKMFK